MRTFDQSDAKPRRVAAHKRYEKPAKFDEASMRPLEVSSNKLTASNQCRHGQSTVDLRVITIIPTIIIRALQRNYIGVARCRCSFILKSIASSLRGT